LAWGRVRISAAAFFAAALAGAFFAPLDRAAAQSGWTLTKTPNPTTYSAAGQVINYTYVFTDVAGCCGNGFVRSISDDKVNPVNCPSNTVPHLGTLTCTGSYTILAADITAGSVTNTVTAQVDICGDDCNFTMTANATVTFAATPSWTLTKTPNPTTYTSAGQTIHYSYLLTNTGNVTITAIAIGDNKVSPVSCPVPTLAAGASTTCTGNYTTTSGDVTAGSVTNTATATGTPTSGTLSPATATATITFVGTPRWTLTKTPNPTSYTATGQVIHYSYLLTNTGNVTINSISIGDNRISLVSCPVNSLAAGASTTCTGNYTITSGDVAEGSVTNSATATGTPTSGTLLPATATATITFVGTPSWTLTKTPSPTTYTGAGQVIHYSYLLTNTGNVTITAIAIVDNRVSPVSCPVPTLAAGASTTCTGNYTTTAGDVTAGSVTNTATALGTPASGTLPPVTATATVTYRVTVGSIAIAKSAVGNDMTFSFTSTVTGATSFGLTTVGGSANRTFASLAAGTYVFTEVNLPPLWVLTALTCVGGTANVINLTNKSVSITLASGGAVTCTFVNTFDTTAHVTKTRDVIARFLGHRASLLADNEPDRARFLRRVPGSLWGDANLPTDRSTMPFSFSGNTSYLTSQMTFATSLTQIAQASAYAEEKAEAAKASSGPRWFKARPNPIAPESGIDIWTEAHYAGYGSNVGNVENKGDFGILYFGADYLATSSVLVGALVQFDWMNEKSSTLNSAVSGRGTMAGPYVSVRLTPNAFFDARAAWGMSSNQVNPFGTYTDGFATDRWLAHAKLTGNWNWQDFRLTPSVAVDYVQEHQRNYTDSMAILIPGQTISLGRLSFGPEIARRFIGSDGTAYEPLASLVGQWDFANPQFASLTGQPVSGDSFHAMAQAGLLARGTNGFSMRVVGKYDGVGSTSFHALGGEIWLNIPLN
jgi:hypothetical protein